MFATLAWQTNKMWCSGMSWCSLHDKKNNPYAKDLVGVTFLTKMVSSLLCFDYAPLVGGMRLFFDPPDVTQSCYIIIFLVWNLSISKCPPALFTLSPFLPPYFCLLPSPSQIPLLPTSLLFPPSSCFALLLAYLVIKPPSLSSTCWLQSSSVRRRCWH